MDASDSEYESPSLSSGMRKRKRAADADSSRARKKQKPALGDLRKLLVTYRSLQQMQREVNEQLAVCRQQIAKHKFGSVPRMSRQRARRRQAQFRRLRSPLREVVQVEEDPPTPSTPPTLWVRVRGWVWGWW
ncbi:uncharacterized protein PGRI_004680 [Penicillium griseofulvum]|uniref:Uncharacterized protein n=1 Tax=Penicillium patulum TaxID=5078 RepID=A0A135LWS9_PENPA|nr:uncharacterized protein PGRI_004680 [Penicillium griseofulvum]KXG53418.1 hypothetical protein PGRI_004680 [Penicillium griseofulvum]